VFASKYEEGGGRRDEVFFLCVCFNGFESEGVDGGESEEFFSFFTK